MLIPTRFRIIAVWSSIVLASAPYAVPVALGAACLIMPGCAKTNGQRLDQAATVYTAAVNSWAARVRAGRVTAAEDARFESARLTARAYIDELGIKLSQSQPITNADAIDAAIQALLAAAQGSN
jgi:hypothetical protein